MKKAQVTLFVIIGIIIVASTALFFIVKNNIDREEIAPGVSLVVEELPSEFLPVKPFVEKCLEQTAKEGLTKLGNRAGYLDTTSIVANDPTQSDGVRFSESSDLVVPYWFYLKSDNNCVGSCEFSSQQIPLKGDIEQDLTQYVDDNLEKCIGNFEEVKKLNLEVKAQDPKSEVIITQKNVVVALTYPLEITRLGSKTQLNNFHISLDLNFADVYDMALYIAQLQKDYRFLERQTLNLLTAFGAKDPNMLPPTAEVDFALSAVEWRKSQVQQNVEDAIVSYTPALRMVNTPTWREIDSGSTYVDDLYNKGMAVPNNSSITHLGVSFAYLPVWPMHFDLNCKGEHCSADSAVMDLVSVGFQQYEFAYDISYPVLVEVSDPQAFNDQGYTFRFMLESNVRNSQVLKSNFVPLPRNQAEPANTCDEQLRTSGDIIIEIEDSLSNDRVDDIEVFYTCFEQSCHMGKTKQGSLTTNLPVCLGGFFTFKKQGYDDLQEFFDAEPRKTDQLALQMHAQHPLDIEVRKKILSKQEGKWIISSSELDLEEYEIATVTIQNANRFDVVESQKDSPGQASLVADDYTIDILLRDTQGLYIAPVRQVVGGEELVSEPINVSQFISGRRVFNYTLRESDIVAQKLIIPVLVVDKSDLTDPQDLDVINRFDSLHRKHFSELLVRTQ